MYFKASMRIRFKTIWYSERLDLLVQPLWIGGTYFYEYENTGALRVVTDIKEWSFIDFI